MIKKLFFLLIFIGVALVLGRNFLIQHGAAAFVKAKSGMTLSMSRFDLGLLSSKLEIENLELLNSARFEKARMVSIPKIFVDISLSRLTSGQLYFKTLQLDLKELTLVRNKQGTLNLKDFQAFKSVKKKEKEKTKEKKSERETSFFIEELELNIGNVVYKDFMTEGAPQVKTFKIGLNKKFHNVDSVYRLFNVIFLETLSRTSIPSLLDMDITEITNLTQGTLDKGTAAAKKAIDRGTEATQKAIDTSSKKMQELEEKAKKSMDEFQKELEKLAPTPAE